MHEQLKLAKEARGLARDQSRMLNRVELLKKLESVMVVYAADQPLASLHPDQSSHILCGAATQI